MGEDLLPESRTWSKEGIMGAKSSRDWLSNWSLGLIGKLRETQYKLNINQSIGWKRKESGDWGTSQQSMSNTRFASLAQYKVAIPNKNGTNPDILF